MNFSEFLQKRRAQKNIATAKDHYESLGGKKVLGISLRHFQQFESGKYPPSEKLLAAVFRRTPASERRLLVLAYFNSVFAEDSSARTLLEYLDQHLTPAIERTSSSLWESNRRLMTYSEDQLEYLTRNNDAFRFHRRLLLLENERLKDCPLSQEKLKEMQKLDLLEVADGVIRPSRSLYRIPNYENSSPRVVAKATDYILKHVEMYAAREGSERQELSYAMQMVTPEAAAKIVGQLKSFKKWVQSLGTTETGPNVTPLLFVGLAKQLDRKEL